MSYQVLLDTNILVYSRYEASPHFKSVCEALKSLTTNGAILCVHNQILREYACVATKLAPKGLGASSERALSDISEFEAAYMVLPDPEGVWSEWKCLIKAGGYKGLILHDIYIAAVMKRYGISAILTLNTKDFDGIQGIRPIKPESWQSIVND